MGLGILKYTKILKIYQNQNLMIKTLEILNIMFCAVEFLIQIEMYKIDFVNGKIHNKKSFTCAVLDNLVSTSLYYIYVCVVPTS